MNKMMQWLAQHQWLAAQVFLVIFASLLAHFVIQRLLRHMAARLQRTETPWDEILVESVSRPLAWLVALLGFSFSIQLVNQDLENTLLAKVDSFRELLMLVLVAWFMIRFVRLAEQTLAQRLANDPQELTTIMAIAKLLRAAIIITVALMGMQSLGYSIEGVLAFGGIGGIAIGFAAKDLLANFFGGLMVYLDRPFVVGDWIRSPDKSIEGTVENIGWRLTCIRTFDQRPLYVPNSVFANIALENPSRMYNRRIYETVGIRYADAAKMGPIVADVRQMLQTHDDIDTGRTLIVNFNSFAPSSLDFFVYTFTKTTNWVEFHAIKQDVLLKILAIIEQHGAEVAFPTSTVHLHNETTEPLA